MFRRTLVLKETDTVGVLLEKGEKGDYVTISGVDMELLEDIDFAHKILLKDLNKNDPIYKYGVQIGYAKENLKKGTWIHGHNMGCDRGKVRRAE